MISNEERRGVSAALRKSDLYPDCELEEALMKAASIDMLEADAVDFSSILADLIDRPTCANLAPRKPDPFIPGKKLADGILECSNCQWHGRVYEYMTDWSGDLGAFEPRYCPHCGSEVVND